MSVVDWISIFKPKGKFKLNEIPSSTYHIQLLLKVFGQFIGILTNSRDDITKVLRMLLSARKPVNESVFDTLKNVYIYM